MKVKCLWLFLWSLLVTQGDSVELSGDNGAGCSFVFNDYDSDYTVAMKACQSKHDDCVASGCGSFYYWYSSADGHCTCGKPIGSFEWMYANYGYDYVGQDYGGGYDSVSGDTSFVRVKTSDTCNSYSWGLALLTLGDTGDTFATCDSCACDAGRAAAPAICEAVACPDGTDGSDLVTGCTCPAGYSGSVLATTSSPFYNNTCEETICDENEYVYSSVCYACAAGTTNAAGDSAVNGDSYCDVTYCDVDEYVSANECLPCDLGYENAAGDDASDKNTSCDAVLCEENFYVSDHTCVPCEEGYISSAGHDASGDDTECVVTECLDNYYVLDNVCTLCPAGYTNLYGDDPTGNDTACDPEPCPDLTNGDSIPAGCMCDDYYVGAVWATSNSPYYDHNCTALLCGENERVVDFDCAPCPEGLYNPPGAERHAQNTECPATACANDWRVSDGACVPCDPGYINGAGDDSTGADTTCDDVFCDEHWYVSDNLCTVCPPGTTNSPGGELQGGDDTYCPHTMCKENEFVSNHECVPCAFGWVIDAGSDASLDNTVCEELAWIPEWPKEEFDGTTFRALMDTVSARLGYTMGRTGDINGDGLEDIIMGAPQQNLNGFESQGAAYVVLGREGGWPSGDFDLTSMSDYTLFSDVSYSGFGYDATLAGDYNGDGFNDMLVSAPDASTVFLVLGGANQTICSDLDNWNIDGSGCDSLYDAGVCDLTDSTTTSSLTCSGIESWIGDGYCDSSSNNNPECDYDGGDCCESTCVDGSYTCGSYGYSCVDPNAEENYFDPYQTYSGSNIFEACCVCGGGEDSEPVNLLDMSNIGFQITSSAGSAGFGLHIASAGDFNGDGYDDILVGAPNQGNGMLYLIYGRASWRDIDADTDGSSSSFIGRSSGGTFGTWFDGVGDINADGLNDFVVGAPGVNDNEGEAFLVFGATELSSTSDTGAGGYMDYIPGNSAYNLALRACNVHHDDCVSGYCSSFYYIYSSAETSCVCGKAEGTYEWIYANYGNSYVGQDLGGGYDDVYGDSSFVRVKTSGGCDSNSWGLALLTLGEDVNSLPLPDGDGAVRIAGLEQGGLSVAGVGDVNGDGFDDVAVYAHHNETLIVFGRAAQECKDISDWMDDYGNTCQDYSDLNWCTDSGGTGAGWSEDSTLSEYVQSGYSALEACCVCGAAPDGLGWPALIETSDCDGINCVSLLLGNESLVLGTAMTGGDFNADGFNDMFIGFSSSEKSGTFVIYGQDGDWAPRYVISEMVAEGRGIMISGIAEMSVPGSLASLDTNQDGYSDVIMGDYMAAVDGVDSAGAVYMLMSPMETVQHVCSVPYVTGAVSEACPEGMLVDEGVECSWTELPQYNCSDLGTNVCHNFDFDALPDCNLVDGWEIMADGYDCVSDEPWIGPYTAEQCAQNCSDFISFVYSTELHNTSNCKCANDCLGEDDLIPDSLFVVSSQIIDCPVNSVGDGLLHDGCDCNAGYSGGVGLQYASPFFNSTCNPVPCPANITEGFDVPSGCNCTINYEGEAWAITEWPFYDTTCTFIPCPFLEIANSNYANSNADRGKIDYLCDDGFSGSDRAECVGGEWQVGECIASSCGPLSIDNSDQWNFVTSQGYTFDTVQFICDPGFSGSGTATCTPVTDSVESEWIWLDCIAVQIINETATTVFLPEIISTTGQQLGYKLGLMGDVNGDGMVDVVFGSPKQQFRYTVVNTFPNSTVTNETTMVFENAGAVYMVFGQADGFSPSIDLGSLATDASTSFPSSDPSFVPEPSYSYSSYSTSSRTRSLSSSFNSSECRDVVDWADQYGDTCNEYVNYGWCTSSGEEASEWPSTWEPLSYYISSEGGLDPTDACCGCGGGRYLSSSSSPSSTSPVDSGSGWRRRLFSSGTDASGANATSEEQSSSTTNLGVMFFLPESNAELGADVTIEGDYNHDGIKDIIITSRVQQTVFVVFGKTEWPASFNVNTLNGTNGFRLNVPFACEDSYGVYVSDAGDFNNDGYTDIALADKANGVVFVVQGRRNWPSVVDTSDAISFASTGAGYWVSSGDVNGDSISDLLIGAPSAAGNAFIVFGAQDNFTCSRCVTAYDTDDEEYEHEWPCCDAAWDSHGYDCYTLQTEYGMDCTGCACPHDTQSLDIVASNGAGGTFTWDPTSNTNYEIAQAACRSVYDDCTTGSCGSFYYWYSSGDGTCTCGKPIDSYEWIYANYGYSYVGSDYGGGYDDVSGDTLFTRVKTSSTCNSDSWGLADKDLSGYTYCASEGGTCYCDGDVRYGYYNSWFVLPSTNGQISCSVDVFGDPYLYYSKTCECHVGGSAAGSWLESLDGTAGVMLTGSSDDSALGRFISGLGDINGDGIEDLGVFASQTETMVIFGHTGEWVSYNPADLDGTNGVLFITDDDEHLGLTMAGVGDVNGDGYKDFLIGYHGVKAGAYLIFGRSELWLASYHISEITDIRGAIFYDGLTLIEEDRPSWATGGGDVTGDGLPDLIFGDYAVKVEGVNNSGTVYVVPGIAAAQCAPDWCPDSFCMSSFVADWMCAIHQDTLDVDDDLNEEYAWVKFSVILPHEARIDSLLEETWYSRSDGFSEPCVDLVFDVSDPARATIDCLVIASGADVVVSFEYAPNFGLWRDYDNHAKLWETFSTDPVSFPAPVLTPDTIHAVDEEGHTTPQVEITADDGTGHTFAIAQFAENGGVYDPGYVSFSGQYFGYDSDFVSITYTNGDHNFSCTIVEMQPDYVFCSLDQLDQDHVGFYNIEITVAGQTTQSEDLMYFESGVPEITSINGCTDDGDVTLDCPTEGGVSITLHGHNLFSADIYQTEQLMSCVYLHPSEGAVCTLLEGVSLAQEFYSSNGHGMGEKFFGVSFHAPQLHNVSAEDCSPSVSTTSIIGTCRREGGNSLIIYGENFGKFGAVVLVGSGICGDLIHHESSPHRVLECTLPPGNSESASIIVIQSGGSIPTAPGLLEYIQCSMGQYQPDVMLTTCTNCSAGTYTSEEGAGSCRLCNKGTYQQNTGQSDCNTCGSGSYQADTGASYCDDCEIGRYSDSSTTKDICAECPIGSFTDHIGSTYCEQCPYQMEQTDIKDTCLCITGCYGVEDTATLNELDGSSFDQYSIFLASQESDELDVNLYLGFWCAQCPEGADCLDPGTMIENVTALPGYFLGSDDTGTTFLECLSEDACDLDNGGCVTGYTGRFCTECEGDLVFSDFECTECVSKSLVIAIVIAGFVAFTFYLMYTILYPQTIDSADLKQVYFKILISSCTINALALSFAFDFAEQLGSMMSTQAEVSSLGTAYLEVGCLLDLPEDGESAFFIENLMYLIGPVAVMFQVLGVAWLAHKWKTCRTGIEVEEEEEEDDTVTHWTDTAVSTCTIVLFLLHPTLTEKVSLMFACVQLGANDEYYLIGDLTMQCWQIEHIFLVAVLAIPMIVLYVVGIPAAGLVLIRRNQRYICQLSHEGMLEADLAPSEVRACEKRKREMSEEDYSAFKSSAHRFHANFSFLYVGYESTWSFWEVVVSTRKTALSLIATMLTADYHAQGLFGLFIMVVALMCHTYARPFQHDSMDVFEFVSLTTSALIFFFGALTYGEGTESSTLQATASFIAYVMMISYLVMALIMGILVADVELMKIGYQTPCHKFLPNLLNDEDEDDEDEVKDKDSEAPKLEGPPERGSYEDDNVFNERMRKYQKKTRRRARQKRLQEFHGKERRRSVMAQQAKKERRERRRDNKKNKRSKNVGKLSLREKRAAMMEANEVELAELGQSPRQGRKRDKSSERGQGRKRDKSSDRGKGRKKDRSGRSRSRGSRDRKRSSSRSKSRNKERPHSSRRKKETLNSDGHPEKGNVAAQPKFDDLLDVDAQKSYDASLDPVAVQSYSTAKSSMQAFSTPRTPKRDVQRPVANTGNMQGYVVADTGNKTEDDDSSDYEEAITL